MLIYKRNITVRLWVLRLTLIVTLPLCIWTFSSGLTNLGYFLAVSLIFIIFFNVAGLSITQSSIHIEKYYFFGFLPFHRTFDKGTVAKAELFQEFDTEYLTGTTTWWDIIAIFIPLKVKLQGMNLKYKRKNGSEGFLRLKLNDKEYNLISQCFKDKVAKPIT